MKSLKECSSKLSFYFFFSGAGFAKPSGLANAWPTTGSAKRQVALPRLANRAWYKRVKWLRLKKDSQAESIVECCELWSEEKNVSGLNNSSYKVSLL